MKRRPAVAVMLLLLFMPFSAAAQRASPEEAQAMVKKAIDFYKKRGREVALAEFNREAGTFVDRELFVSVYTLDGLCLAHNNPRMRGIDAIELRDPYGRYYVRERVEAARTDISGWQEYRSFNSVTRKMDLERLYWEKHDNLVFGSGSFRQMNLRLD